MEEEIQRESKHLGADDIATEDIQFAHALRMVQEERRFTENQRRALDLLMTCCDGMGYDHIDCPGCGPMRSQGDVPHQQAQAELKQVSSCCKADFFRDGDRVVCNACRLGTKLIHVSAS